MLKELENLELESLFQSLADCIPPGRLRLKDGREIYKRDFIKEFVLPRKNENTLGNGELVKSLLNKNVDKYIVDDKYIEYKFDEMANNMITENKKADYQFFLEGLDGIDLREKFDLDGLSTEMFRYLSFDSKTIFSDIQMNKFKPYQHIEQGKKTERTGFKLDGEGTCIAILDKFSDISSEEFGGEVVKYIIHNSENGVEVILDKGEKNADSIIYRGGQDGSFHGNTVASLVAGKECGVIPKTKVILFEVAKRDIGNGVTEDEVDPKIAKEAMLKFINNSDEINPDIISISDSTELTQNARVAKEELNKNGCAYIDSSVFWKFFAWGRKNDNNGEITLDPLIKKVCESPDSNKGKVAGIKKAIMDSVIVPYTQRTSTHLNTNKNGEKEIAYKYNGSFCGASFVIPQIAGLFLKARQIDKSISFDKFIEFIGNTAKLNNDNMKYLDEERVLSKVFTQRKEKNKSKPILFSEQVVGKTTVNTSISLKDKLRGQVEREVSQRGKRDKCQ